VIDLDALVELKPTLVAVMEPEPAWVWARCATCADA
jgi:hypothetical protein